MSPDPTGTGRVAPYPAPGTRSRVRNARQLKSLRERSRDARQAALRVIANARRNDRSIAQSIRAVRAEGYPVSKYGVLKYAGEAVERGPGGRLVATSRDRIYRRISLPTAEGNVLVDTRSSRRASLAGQFRNAVKAFLEGRDPDGEGLRRFRGEQVGPVRLLTDLDALERLARQHALEELQEEGS